MIFKQYLLASVILLCLASTLANAQTAQLEDTTIDYLSYREVNADAPWLVYQIKIKNTGKESATYEILPDTNAVKQIGTYRIDPSSKLTLDRKEEQTVYLYLNMDKEVSGRQQVPVEIRSGSKSVNITLVARPAGAYIQDEKKPNQTTRNVIVLLLLILLLVIIARVFAGRKKEKDETYY